MGVGIFCLFVFCDFFVCVVLSDQTSSEAVQGTTLLGLQVYELIFGVLGRCLWVLGVLGAGLGVASPRRIHMCIYTDEVPILTIILTCSYDVPTWRRHMNARAGSLTLSRAIYGRGLVSMQQCDVYNVVVSLQTLYMMYAYFIVFSSTF